MTAKRFTYDEFEDCIVDNVTGKTYWGLDDILNNKLNELHDENEQLKSFIDDLTTKGTGRIDLANGYSYSVSAVLTNWKGDVE